MAAQASSLSLSKPSLRAMRHAVAKPIRSQVAKQARPGLSAISYQRTSPLVVCQASKPDVKTR